VGCGWGVGPQCPGACSRGGPVPVRFISQLKKKEGPMKTRMTDLEENDPWLGTFWTPKKVLGTQRKLVCLIAGSRGEKKRMFRMEGGLETGNALAILSS